METSSSSYQSATNQNQNKWERVWRNAQESRRGGFTFLAIARWAIKHAADLEPDPDVRRARKTLLLNKWRATFALPGIG